MPTWVKVVPWNDLSNIYRKGHREDGDRCVRLAESMSSSATSYSTLTIVCDEQNPVLILSLSNDQTSS